MLKPLTLSLSLVVALGASSVSMAGLFDNHHSGGMASPQSVIASPQAIMPSAQCDTGGCGDVCDTGGKKHCKLLGFLNRPKNYSYTWVLKKKRIHGHKGNDCYGGGGCDSCETAVYPSGQYASPQAYGSSQAYGSGQAHSAPAPYGSGQAYGGASGQAYGGASGQAHSATSAGQIAPAPSSDEAPPAPEVPSESSAPEAPEAPSPNAPQSSLLFSTPSGN